MLLVMLCCCYYYKARSHRKKKTNTGFKCDQLSCNAWYQRATHNKAAFTLTTSVMDVRAPHSQATKTQLCSKIKNRHDPKDIRSCCEPPSSHRPQPNSLQIEDKRDGYTIKIRPAQTHSRTVKCTSGVTCISFPFCFIKYMHSAFSFHRTEKTTTMVPPLP